jgi:hypothetical protein
MIKGAPRAPDENTRRFQHAANLGETSEKIVNVAKGPRGEDYILAGCGDRSEVSHVLLRERDPQRFRCCQLSGETELCLCNVDPSVGRAVWSPSADL